MSVNPSQSWITPTTALFSSGGGGGGSNFPTGLTIGTSGQGGITAGVSTINATLVTPQTGLVWIPQYYTFRPTQAVNGGLVANIIEWDAVDTGANFALVFGANADTSFITSQWPGYISMPLDFSGATLTLRSDNETFLFGDGKAGALGTLSTGTPFLSGSNLFSSITTPVGLNGSYKANTYALFSTLQTSYPACFS